MQELKVNDQMWTLQDRAVTALHNQHLCLFSNEGGGKKNTITFIPTVLCKPVIDLRPSVLGQDRPQTKKSVLVLHMVVLGLHVWCCVVKHGLVTLVVIMILKDATTFQVPFIVSIYCAWNITTVEINSAVYLLKFKDAPGQLADSHHTVRKQMGGL